MAYQSFEDLDVWKEACRLSLDVYNQLCKTKEYFMRDQILRSALSFPSNIAEGAERNSQKEFIRFLHIAKGSYGELRTQLYLATRMNLITSDSAKPLLEETRKISAKLQNLVKAIESKIS